MVALGHDVFGGFEPLLNGGGHPTFEENGRARFAHLAQQVVVLHVAGADLKNRGMLGDQCHIAHVHDLGDDGQAGDFGCFLEILQAFLAQTLKIVRRRARLERAPP